VRIKQVFDAPRYIQNSFNIFFQRQPSIRRKADTFETMLEDTYDPPLVLPIPDDQEPELPRMVFGSKTGYSQIVISQVSIALNVQYSSEFQIDISKGRAYLFDRVPTLFQLLGKLNTSANYCGFATIVNLPSDKDDAPIVDNLAARFLTNIDDTDLYDVQFKTTKLIDKLFFSNITVTNYRGWQTGVPQKNVRFSEADVAERGVQIVGDYNDRYAYNEKKGYNSGSAKFKPIIEGGLEAVAQMITRISEVQS
jgi:hypothetical protein